MATKQTRKTTSAKRPVKATQKTTTRGRKPATVSKRKADENVQKKNNFAYAMAGVWTILAGVLLGIFTYGSAEGIVAGFIFLFVCSLFII